MTTSNAGGLRARIRTRDGWAVPHAVLTVTDMAGQQAVRQEADAEGLVTTDALAPGTYTVIVTAIGYAHTAIGATLRVELDIQAVQGGQLPSPG
jgi:hypothetical protein